MQLQHPGAKSEEYASLDEEFAAFMECREMTEAVAKGECCGFCLPCVSSQSFGLRLTRQ